MVECWLVNAVREYLWLLHVTVKVRQIFGSEEKFESFSHLRAARRNRVLRGKRQRNIPKETVPQVVRNGLHLRPHPLRTVQHTKPVDLSEVHKKKWLMITPFKGGWFSLARRHFIRRVE